MIYARPSGPRDQFAPDEHSEQATLVTRLKRAHIWYHSIPNAAATSARRQAHMKKEGLRPGVPDLYIIDKGARVAIEMKRANGRNSDVKPEQLKALEHLEREGWTCIVAFGYKAAEAELIHLGLLEPSGEPRRRGKSVTPLAV